MNESRPGVRSHQRGQDRRGGMHRRRPAAVSPRGRSRGGTRVSPLAPGGSTGEHADRGAASQIPAEGPKTGT